MKHIYPILVLLLFMTLRATAQVNEGTPRERYLNELRTYKHNFLTRELELDREQQRNFFELYDSMEDRLQQLNDQTRELERNVVNDSEATDVEVDAAINAIYSQKQKEADIENEFLPRMREILSPRQLLKLKQSERMFNQQLVRQHRRVRNDDKPRGMHKGN